MGGYNASIIIFLRSDGYHYQDGRYQYRGPFRMLITRHNKFLVRFMMPRQLVRERLSRDCVDFAFDSIALV